MCIGCGVCTLLPRTNRDLYGQWKGRS
ncbi:MAG: hypothetical protein ABSF09_09405 [Candidatus Bathyarchaeia archaeon]